MATKLIPAELEEMLESIRTPVIFSTVDDPPHATPMNWLWQKGEQTFWFNPAGGSKKIVNMKKSPYVCFGTEECMEKKSRGFIVWGEITGFEYGLRGLLKNIRPKIRMLKKKSGINFFDPGVYKFWKTYARHPDIHYSTLPWVAASVRVVPERIVYHTENGVEKKVEF